MPQDKLSPETMTKIRNWASDNAQTETENFNETRYIGLIDGYTACAEEMEKLRKALELIAGGYDLTGETVQPGIHIGYSGARLIAEKALKAEGGGK